jgi:hypothetical protein
VENYPVLACFGLEKSKRLVQGLVALVGRIGIIRINFIVGVLSD